MTQRVESRADRVHARAFAGIGFHASYARHVFVVFLLTAIAAGAIAASAGHGDGDAGAVAAVVSGSVNYRGRTRIRWCDFTR